MQKMIIHRKRGPEIIAATVLTAVTGLILFFLGIIDFYPYRIEKVQEMVHRNLYERYLDMNRDGITDRVTFCKYGQFISVEVYAMNVEFINLVRLKGDWPPKFPYHFFGDSDQDGSNEIYALTISNDSLFLNILDDFLLSSPKHRQIYVDQTQAVEGSYDYYLSYLEITDLDNNGQMEIFFGVHGGYSLVPRKMYIYHPELDTLYKSEDLGCGYFDPGFSDIDGDGYLEILCGTLATQNYSPNTEIPVGDHVAAGCVFDHELKRKYTSRLFREGKPGFIIFSMERESDTVICGIYLQNAQLSDNMLYLMDKNLVIQDSSALSEDRFFHRELLGSEGESLDYLLDSRGNIYRVSSEPLGIHKLELQGFFYDYVHNSAKDLAGVYYLNGGRTSQLVDYKLNPLCKPFEVNLNASAVDIIDSNSPGAYSLYCHYDQDKISIEYRIEASRVYQYRFFLVLPIILLLWLVFYFFSWMAVYLIQRRRLAEYNMHSYQLLSIQNQLHPHFTFNILNSVGSLIMNDDKEKGYSYLSSMADLLRSVLDHGNDSYWSLSEELNFIRIYVELENARFNNKFLFEAEDINVDLRLLIPKMMIQTFIENALRHGLVHKESDCTLSLKISRTGGQIAVLIEDNGIGRAEASRISRNGSGNGLRLVKQFMNSYNKLHRNQFSLEIIDLKTEDGEAKGTRVELIIPDDIRQLSNRD